MTAKQIIDPWDSAENPQEIVFTNVYWGQVEAQSHYCVLEKGVGKVEFDPQVHSVDQRRTAIDILIHPLPETGAQWDITRGVIAESHEWAGVILPSLRELGIQARELNGKWVRVERVPLADKLGNPQTYVDKTGTVKEQTTLKFIAVFADRASCLADFQKGRGTHPAPASTPANGGNGNSNGEREAALKFLKVYVQNACKGQSDLTVIRETLALNLAQQPLISKYFTVDSPETTALIAEFIGG